MPDTVDVEPGMTTEVNGSVLTDVNETVNVSSVYAVGYPFPVDVDTQDIVQSNTTGHVNISVTPPSTFQPGQYTGTIYIETNSSVYSNDLTITVTEKTEWNTSLQNWNRSVSIGTTPQIGSITLQNTGNTPVTGSVTISGNMSQFLSVQRQHTVYPGSNATIRFEAVVPGDTRFGRYHANLSVSNGSVNETVSVSSYFADQDPPQVEEISIESFMATQPVPFTVSVTDNVGVDNVTADIVYRETVTEDNETVVKERTLEELVFNKTGDVSNTWTTEVENNGRIGSYTVLGTVYDEAGNTVQFNDTFQINGLDTINPVGQADFRLFSVDSEATTLIGSVSKDTPYNLTLTRFSEPLETEVNESWDIGVIASEGRRFFSSVNDTISLQQAGEVELFVRGDQIEQFNGRVRWTSVEQHVGDPVGTTYFNGEFKNFSQVQDETFSVLGRMYRCEANRTGVKATQHAVCRFKVYGREIPSGSSIQDAVKIGYPAQVEQGEIRSLERRLEDVNGAVWMRGLFVVLLFTGLTGLGTYLYFDKRFAGQVASVKMPKTREERKQVLNENHLYSGEDKNWELIVATVLVAAVAYIFIL